MINRPRASARFVDSASPTMTAAMLAKVAMSTTVSVVDRRASCSANPLVPSASSGHAAVHTSASKTAAPTSHTVRANGSRSPTIAHTIPAPTAPTPSENTARVGERTRPAPMRVTCLLLLSLRTLTVVVSALEPLALACAVGSASDNRIILESGTKRAADDTRGRHEPPDPEVLRPARSDHQLGADQVGL